jgi:RNA polymerase sigma-70 factor (ECF subfamily)
MLRKTSVRDKSATRPFFVCHATICPAVATHVQNQRMTLVADRFLVETFLLTRDESVFRWLYRRHQESLWRFALRLTGGDTSASADIVQDAWLRAIEKLPQFRWQSSLRTWLLGFVVFRTKEFWRSQLSENQRFASIEEAIFESVEGGFSEADLDLETAFAQLPPGYRAVLTLHDLEGYKHEEIAELLGIAVGTSKSQLARGRAFLRRFFEDERA